MKIKLIRDTIVGGKPEETGSVLDVPEDEGLLLVAIGKAIESDEEVGAVPPSGEDLEVDPEEEDLDDEDPDAMTVAELAEYYDVSESAVRRIVSDLEPVGKRGNANLFSMADVEEAREE